MFILFEGPDGVGKSTLAAFTAFYLSTHGIYAIKTKEPGSPEVPACAALRDIIFNKNYGKELPPIVRDLLFFTDHHLHSLAVKKWLSNGFTVISDRWSFSEFCYSQVKQGATEAERLYFSYSMTDPKPDITFILALDPTEIKRRISQREKQDGRQTHKMWGGEEYWAQISAAYADLPQKYESFSKKWVRLLQDSNAPVEAVFQSCILPHIEKELS